MYLFYLDESDNPDDASDRHFVLAELARAFAIVERDRVRLRPLPIRTEEL